MSTLTNLFLNFLTVSFKPHLTKKIINKSCLWAFPNLLQKRMGRTGSCDFLTLLNSSKDLQNDLGKTSRKNDVVLLNFCPNYPLPPNWSLGQLVPLFLTSKTSIKRYSKWLIIQNSSYIKDECLLCGSCIQPKRNSLKFKLLALGRK